MHRKLATAVFILLATLIGLEGALRLVPSAIPLQLLVHFEGELRSEIAQRLGLPSRFIVRRVVRDDGGPPLIINRPNVTLPLGDRTFTTDSEGFCNPPGAEGGRRADIVAIGDSFTWCTEVAADLAWPRELGRISGLSVFNLGLPRLGPYEYLQLLKRYGLAKCPRVVVMAIYEGNDLRDAVAYAKHVTRRGEQSETEPGAFAEFVNMLHSGSVARHSYVFNLPFAVAAELGATWARGSAYATVPWIGNEPVDFRYELDFGTARQQFNRHNTDRDEVIVAQRLSRGEFALSVFDGAMAAYVDLASSRGFVPALVYIPSAYTAYADFVRFRDPTLQSLMPTLSHGLRTYFAQSATRFGYRFIDATPALQAAARRFRDSPLLYFASNLHLTAEGHEVVAQAIFEFAAMAKDTAGASSPPQSECP